MSSSRDILVSTPTRPESLTGLQPLTKQHIDHIIAEITATVAAQFEDAAPIPIRYLGEEILPRPVDTARFVRIMSRYMVLN